MPASISLIRHAEKQFGDGPPHGVLVDGSHDPESLIPRGWQRAGALVGLFVPRADQPGAAVLPNAHPAGRIGGRPAQPQSAAAGNAATT